MSRPASIRNEYFNRCVENFNPLYGSWTINFELSEMPPVRVIAGRLNWELRMKNVGSQRCLRGTWVEGFQKPMSEIGKSGVACCQFGFGAALLQVQNRARCCYRVCKKEKHGLPRIKSWQTSNTKTGTMSRTARCRSGVSCGEHENTS